MNFKKGVRLTPLALGNSTRPLKLRRLTQSGMWRPLPFPCKLFKTLFSKHFFTLILRIKIKLLAANFLSFQALLLYLKKNLRLSSQSNFYHLALQALTFRHWKRNFVDQLTWNLKQSYVLAYILLYQKLFFKTILILIFLVLTYILIQDFNFRCYDA